MSDEFENFLQIVHVSDLHFSVAVDWSEVHKGFWDFIDHLPENLRQLGPAHVSRILREGMAPSSASAVVAFRGFMKELAAATDAGKVATWLVDTGDLSTFGDNASLAAGDSFLADFKANGLVQEVFSLHGNHDAWPGKFWAVAKKGEIAGQAALLREPQNRKPQPKMLSHLSGTTEVQLFGLDSVLYDDYWRNLVALGEVPEKEGGASASLHALEKEIDASGNQPERDILRIVAVHHPVHYPPPKPSSSMSMWNDRRVAQLLGGRTAGGWLPWAHLLLSGHTHESYPPLGTLPDAPQECDHSPLLPDQCQLVSGSLLQTDLFGKRGITPFTFQLLRFGRSNAYPGYVRMERSIVGRGRVNPDFKVLPTPSRAVETMTFAVFERGAGK